MAVVVVVVVVMAVVMVVIVVVNVENGNLVVIRLPSLVPDR